LRERKVLKMKKLGPILGLAKLVRYVSNWQDVLAVYFGRRPGTIVRFRNGITLEVRRRGISAVILLCGVRGIVDNGQSLLFNGLVIPKAADKSTIVNAIEFVSCGGVLTKTPHGIMSMIGKNKFFVRENDLVGLGGIIQVFLRQTYGYIDPKGKVVLDIGAFIGDTAVWFSKKGASRVIAYEPYKPMFDLAVQNIDLNCDSNDINIYNCGVGKETKPARLNVIGGRYGCNRTEIGKGEIKTSDIIDTVEVCIVSIKDVLENAGRVDAIKMDCEGAEYEILEAIAEQGIKNLAGKEIILETHYLDEKRNAGYAKELLKKCGYTKIKRVVNCSKDNMIMYAKK
jgi:FkbM family methyltransferase